MCIYNIYNNHYSRVIIIIYMKIIITIVDIDCELFRCRAAFPERFINIRSMLRRNADEYRIKYKDSAVQWIQQASPL